MDSTLLFLVHSNICPTQNNKRKRWHGEEERKSKEKGASMIIGPKVTYLGDHFKSSDLSYQDDVANYNSLYKAMD